MSKKTFSDAMSELDGKYIDEALSYNEEAGRIRRIRRLPVAAAAVIAALLLLGGAVWAAGGFGTQLKDFFHSEDESGFDLSVAIEKTPVEELSEGIREVGDTIKLQFENYDVFSSWYPGSWQTVFSSRDEACDFIGFDRLKRIDPGCDEQETLLNVLGNEQGQILSVDLETRYTAGDMNLQFFSWIYTENYEDEIEIGVRTTESLEYEEIFYTSDNDKQCQIISSSALESGYLCMDGYIVDDGVLYTLHIVYRESAAAQATELIHHWADLF